MCPTKRGIEQTRQLRHSLPDRFLGFAIVVANKGILRVMDKFANPPRSILCAICAGMLLFAVSKHGYGFFTALRFLVCGSSTYVCWEAFSSKQAWWAVGFGAIAVLFNPVMPIHLDRNIWEWIDIGVAALFGAVWAFAKFDQAHPNGSG